jgi:hypothetical protein
MKPHLFPLLLTVALAVGSAACASAPDPEEEETGTTASDLALEGTRLLGSIGAGETKEGRYTPSPLHRAYGFQASAGDDIVADVTVGARAMAYITDASFVVLARAQGGPGTKVRFRVPAGEPTRPYRIVFRNAASADAPFSVKLSVLGAAGTCTYGGKSYVSGATFASIDGCNTCTCRPSGAVTCTQQACGCNPGAEPWRDYYGSPKECVTIHYSCPPGETEFANSCGCGCERPH